MDISPAPMEQTRVPFSVEVASESDLPAGTRRYLAMDLSLGGLFLKTVFPLDVGTILLLTFDIPGERLIVKARAEVAWIRRCGPDSRLPPGMGIRFLGLDASDRILIGRHVAREEAAVWIA